MGIQAIIESGVGSSGGTPPSSVAPPNVTAITVTGFINPTTNLITLTVGVTPAATLGTFIGCHIWLNVPDQSAKPGYRVGISAAGGTDAVRGTSFLIDCGDQIYDSTEQPWTVQVPGPSGLNASVNNPARLYASSISVVSDNALVLFGASGATPSQTFTLVSLASGSPTSGTNVTTLTGDDNALIGIVATALAPVNVTGKLETPVEVLLTSTPPNTNGWVSRLVVTIGPMANAAPNVKANQQVIPGYITEAGPVYAPAGDGISVPHSFALDTPKAFTNAVVWLQAGLLKNGVYTWNNIVPGITPSFGFIYGSTTGTTDASAIMIATIDTSMAVNNSLFGVAPMGITNPLIGPGAIYTINYAALSILNPALGALAVEANNMASGSITASNAALAASSVVAINMAANSITASNAALANLTVGGAQMQNLTVTNLQVAIGTIGSLQIGTATIAQSNMAASSIGNAQIQSLAVMDGNINDCSISKLTAGSATFTGTATFTGSGGDYIQINSTGILLQGAGSNIFLQISSSGLTISGAASSYVQLNSSGLTIQGTSTAYVQITSTQLIMFCASNSHITLDSSSGTITLTSNSLATTITGNTITTGTVDTSGLAFQFLTYSALSFSGSASAGSATLPALPVGFIPFIGPGGSTYKIPAYNT